MNEGVTSCHAFNGPKNRVIHVLNTSKGAYLADLMIRDHTIKPC